MKKLLLVLMILCTLFSAACRNTEKEKAPEPEPVKQLSFVIYRAAADGSEKLIPEKITMEDNGRSLPENALEALVGTKPKDARMDDVIPIGTKVLGLKIDKDGTAFADFSRELAKKSQGSYEELMIAYAITNTLTEFPEIKRVQILIEGEKVITLSGHMDLEDPLERNTTLLEKK